MKFKIYLKSLLGTLVITWCIGFGIAIVGSHRFWGYFNYFLGTLTLFYLCWKFFSSEKSANRKQEVEK